MADNPKRANPSSNDLSAFSDQLADAVQTAGAWTVRVSARRGVPASGVAFGPDLVLTADHVVDPSKEQAIRVGLPNGKEVAATLVGRDPASDLAVLRVPDAGLTPAQAGVSPRTGSLGLVVARPRSEPSASLALVVGTGGPARTRRGGMLERFIEVDTVMYPGFSGGPLVDVRGTVLGISTSGLAFAGPAVAIPWDVATGLANVLVEHGKVRRGYLGLGSQPLQLAAAARELAGGQERGLLALHVAEGGPATQAGFLQGDILVKLDDTPITNADDLQALLGPQRVGATMIAMVVRGGETKELSVVIGSRE